MLPTYAPGKHIFAAQTLEEVDSLPPQAKALRYTGTVSNASATMLKNSIDHVYDYDVRVVLRN